MTKQQSGLIAFGLGFALALLLLLWLTGCGAEGERSSPGDAAGDARELPEAGVAIWPDAAAKGWPAGCAPLLRDGGVVPGALCELPQLPPKGCL